MEIVCIAVLIGSMAAVKPDDMALSALVKPGEPERIATDLEFTEGPVWYPDGYLLFSDIPGNTIYKWTPDGVVETFRSPSGHSNGLTFDRQGRLIACEHSNRRVTRTELDGTIVTLADKYDGKRLNSPNDAVVKSDGSIYFTDPPYGLDNFTAWKELNFDGVYRITPDGELLLLVDDFERPNGLAFSPDETTLYVNDTLRKHIRAFDVGMDGSISNGRVLIEMEEPEPGGPDGMKVDSQGNIYCTGPGGIWVIAPGGKRLGRMAIPELPANFAWGDADWKTLYIAARSSIYCLQLLIPGIAVWKT